MKSAFLIPPGSSLEKWVAFASDEGIDGVEPMFFSPQVSDFGSAAETAWFECAVEGRLLEAPIAKG